MGKLGCSRERGPKKDSKKHDSRGRHPQHRPVDSTGVESTMCRKSHACVAYIWPCSSSMENMDHFPSVRSNCMCWACVCFHFAYLERFWLWYQGESFLFHYNLKISGGEIQSVFLVLPTVEPSGAGLPTPYENGVRKQLYGCNLLECHSFKFVIQVTNPWVLVTNPWVLGGY